MTELIHQFELQIFSIVGALAVIFIRYLFRAKSKLVYSIPHSFSYMVNSEGDQQPFLVFTASIWIQNLGRQPATDIEFTFNYKPQNYNVWPPRPYEGCTHTDGRYTLKFLNMAPNELIQIGLINSKQELPNVVSFRSKEGIGTILMMQPCPVISKPTLYGLWFLVFAGVAALIYAAAAFVYPYLSSALAH